MREPQPLPVAEWMAAAVAPGASSAALDSALEQGSFTLPAKGKAYGLDWTPLAPGKDGELSSKLPAGWSIYAAAQVAVPAGRRAFGRFDTIFQVYAASARQPGDPYGSRRVRVPLAAAPGSSALVVVDGYARGAQRPQAELFTTEDELHLNLEDATLPDLVAGDATELWIGAPVLSLTDQPALEVVARIEESAELAATETRHPALAAGAVTMLPFRLALKAPPAVAGHKVTAALRVESPSLAFAYRRTVELVVVAAGATHRRTFRSPMDGSVQYYGVVPPSSFDPAKSYALVLSLHGASVEAIGQAKSYSAKDWAYIVAATNRRPFGFDWEEFGRVEALETLDHALASFKIAPERVYLTGHSMGGHGTYHLGVHFPGRFATIGPSAGWSSFESYGGTAHPSGAVGRARAASKTLDYVGNLARRGAYILQGEKDDNVPKSEALLMLGALQKVTKDVVYYEEPGAGHWWDGDKSPGVDCVDWPPLFAFMQARQLDPTELEFSFRTPSPWVSSRHSFVTIRSAADAYQDCVVESKPSSSDSVALKTTNVRSLLLDGAALKAKGVGKVAVDGVEHAVGGGPIAIGPQDGKRPGVHGPLNEVFQRPFCFVYPAAGKASSLAFERYAAYLVSTWAVLGNGLACALPADRVSAATRASHNLIYVGVQRGEAPPFAALGWDKGSVSVGDKSYPAAALAAVFPDGDRLAATFSTTAGAEHLLFRYHPFTSRSGLPDYFVWAAGGSIASGFFSPTWSY
jgi:poly(3-hydroxybutyrate) depolymerase